MTRVAASRAPPLGAIDTVQTGDSVKSVLQAFKQMRIAQAVKRVLPWGLAISQKRESHVDRALLESNQDWTALAVTYVTPADSATVLYAATAQLVRSIMTRMLRQRAKIAQPDSSRRIQPRHHAPSVHWAHILQLVQEGVKTVQQADIWRCHLVVVLRLTA